MAEALDFPVELEQTGYEVRLAEPHPERSAALFSVRKRFRRLFGPVRARARAMLARDLHGHLRVAAIAMDVALARAAPLPYSERCRQLRRYCDVNGRVLNGIPLHIHVLEADAPAR
jgi:hypothetical protein